MNPGWALQKLKIGDHNLDMRLPNTIWGLFPHSEKLVFWVVDKRRSILSDVRARSNWTSTKATHPRCKASTSPQRASPCPIHVHMPTAKLVASDANVSPHEIPLIGLPLRVGRSTDANICVEDRWVSRDHCVIEWTSESLTVRDLHSRHGTYVNGRSVSSAPLHSGDELTVGLSKFVVLVEEEPAEMAYA